MELSWEAGTAKAKAAVKVSLEDFRCLVGDVERLSQDFMDLQKKHELRCRYTKEWENANPGALMNWAAYQATLAN